jgi:hypothetical protein
MFKRDAESGFYCEPRSMRTAKYGLILSVFVCLAAIVCMAQAKPAPAPPTAQSDDNISGMYSFEREGEFVQVTVEVRSTKADKTKPLAVTGFISRYGDTESDRGAFLDYFINTGTLDGDSIHFVTKPVHGIAYEFTGKVVRGTVTREKDGYFELRGTLVQNAMQRDKVVSSKQREITMKLFPDLDRPAKTPTSAKN